MRLRKRCEQDLNNKAIEFYIFIYLFIIKNLKRHYWIHLKLLIVAFENKSPLDSLNQRKRSNDIKKILMK